MMQPFRPPNCAWRRWFAVLTVAAVSLACNEPAGPAPAPSQERPAAVPPQETFEPPLVELRKTSDTDDDPARLPDATLRPWRVLMLQERPRPRKRPQWQSIEAKVGGSIAMPEGSRWQCLYTPVRISAQADEDMRSIERWSVVRGVRCSSDGWQTHAEALHAFHLVDEGELITPVEQTELYLREVVDGRPLEITIVLRADERKVPRPILGPAAKKTATGSNGDSPPEGQP